MDWREFAVQMASMARELLAQESVSATLERITSSAVELIDGCDAAGVLVLGNGRAETLAPTDRLVNDSDRLQEQLGEGPCLDAARAGHPVFRIADLDDEPGRWPSYAPQAHALGIGSVMGFLLYTDDDDHLGALTLYSKRPGAFTDACETAGWLLASHAAVAFSSAREHASMRRAVETRHVIGEAMGILMARHGLDEDGAFDVLRRYSQEHNVKLREVARQLCEQGTLQDGGTPPGPGPSRAGA
ncbi:GAF and ANTAR domain-containing protein [Streptomyces sp. NPDC002564]|uniref:GAF and ANTAR domain-containing protein n=1 Tax=Streptomyces sp. NPDC002564 TaxID=3364649 RepID=UPI003683303A